MFIQFFFLICLFMIPLSSLTLLTVADILSHSVGLIVLMSSLAIACI